MMKLFFLFLLISNFSFSQDDVLWGDSYSLEVGTTQYLFGDNVKMRKEPSTDSEELEILAIGTPVTILEMSEEKMDYQGVYWNWYKVKAGNDTGYILGGLIALRHSEINGSRYMISLRRAKNTDEYEEDTYMQYRLVTQGDNYLSGESILYTHSFSIHANDDRGVDGIQNMLLINLEADACGVDGGGIYIFNDGDKLIEAIRLSSVADGGVFWFTESLIFPNDEHGQEGVINYEREHGVSVNEQIGWTRAQVDNMFLEWKDGKFVPDIEEIDFDNSELDEGF